MKMIRKMKISAVSIFPQIFSVLSDYGVTGKALEKKLIDFTAFDLREFTSDKHKVTDRPGFGGGAGMVMLIEPFFNFYDYYMKTYSVKPYVVLMSPAGKTFTNDIARELSQKDDLVFFCGRYEGIDERINSIVDMELSAGDFVMTGGELPSMLMIDAISRFIPGVVGDENSVINDSFYDGLLDYPHYTKPAVFRNMTVPEVLRSGNHKEIDLYRKKQSFINTILKRPDLFIKRELSAEDKKVLVEIITELIKDA